MWNALKARLREGHRTGPFPTAAAPVLPDRFCGRPALDDSRCSRCGDCVKLCPSGALAIDDAGLALDIGKCIFCGACVEVCPAQAIGFTREYRLAAMRRETLVVRPGQAVYEPERPHDREFLSYCGQSLKIRQISAGGCAACELDFNVLNTLAWDMGRFGIQVVASPRHADCLLVTGPVSDNMQLALEKSYAAMPRPKWVIACGACAVSGGMFVPGGTVLGGVERRFPVDLFIPGCPPHPATILEGLLRLMGREFRGAAS